VANAAVWHREENESRILGTVSPNPHVFLAQNDPSLRRRVFFHSSTGDGD